MTQYVVGPIRQNLLFLSTYTLFVVLLDFVEWLFAYFRERRSNNFYSIEKKNRIALITFFYLINETISNGLTTTKAKLESKWYANQQLDCDDVHNYLSMNVQILAQSRFKSY